ncbi:MAG: tetratricopeptide repeat protein [Synergistaceae bacterium]|nr:tetratricopeptide repeat protein [Synergistaceae bacterium]
MNKATIPLMNRLQTRKRAFVWVFAVFFCVFFCGFFTLAPEARANGNTSADDLAPQPQIKQVKKSVRKAPIKRPPKKAPKKAAVLEEAPPMPTPLEIGISLVEDGRYEQARPWLQKAVQQERHNPHAWYWYGIVHEKMGQFQQAQFFYARTLALDPAFPPFARVVAYPDEGDRKPLWDPLRPPRVYPVDTVSHGVAIIPPSAPEATVRPPHPPIDPEIPKVPRYVPPDPVEPIIPGDALQPPVYVPPSAPESLAPIEAFPAPIPHFQPVPEPRPAPTPPAVAQPPVYMPPEPQAAPAPPAAAQTPVYTPPEPRATPAPPAEGRTPVYMPPAPPSPGAK